MKIQHMKIQRMKRLTCLSVLLAVLLLALPQTAYAGAVDMPELGTELEFEFMVFWLAVPVDYEGATNVYLHSDHNPIGEPIFFETLYYNDKWKLCRGELMETLPQDTYWVTTSTADGGGFFADGIGAGFPDLEQRSLLPNLDTKITSMEMRVPYIEAETFYSAATYEGYIGMDTEGSGFPQFFCIFDTVERFPETVKNVEAIFRQLIPEYAASLYEFWSIDAVISFLVPLYWESGHFDDYVNIYQPLGVTLYDYMYKYTRNGFLSWMTRHDNNLEVLLHHFCRENPDSEYTISNKRANYILILKNWGWDIWYDTRNLEYDEEGDCITEFGVFEDGVKNLLFPGLGDVIPDDLPLIVQSDGSVVEKGSSPLPTGSLFPDKPSPTKTPDTPQVEGEDGKPTGGEIIETFPSKKPQQPQGTGDEDDTETKKGLPPLVPVGAAAVVCVTGAVVFFKKRK